MSDRRSGCRFGSARAVDVCSVVDVNGVHALRFVVDAVEQPVGTAASTEQAGEFAFERVADATRLASEVAEGELDDRRDEAGRDAV
jgi:hypothetical protein